MKPTVPRAKGAQRSHLMSGKDYEAMAAATARTAGFVLLPHVYRYGFGLGWGWGWGGVWVGVGSGLGWGLGWG